MAKNQRVKPADRARRTARFRERAMMDLGYEFDTCVQDARRLVRGPDDPIERNAYLEAQTSGSRHGVTVEIQAALTW